MQLNLEGKRVLVTGSSRGIGLAIAGAFLAEEAKVVLTSRKQTDLNRLKKSLSNYYPPDSIIASACDFTDTKAITDLYKVIMNEWDGLDILVLNVGNGKSSPDPVPDGVCFGRTFQLNFDVAVNTTREFYPLLKKSAGNILFITSIAGVEAFGAPTDYAAAKSALISFSKNLARKAAADGVRVNCIAPGNIFFEGGVWDTKIQADPEGIQRVIETTVPMRRFGKPEEIAAAALFLCSECSSFTTGTCLIIDGGQTVSVV